MRSRRAFTLTEVLMVVTIIALLMTITVSSVYRLQVAQRETNTNTHLLKIDTQLLTQWHATVEQIRKENPPQAVKELTKNADGTYDPARAKAFHMKMRLRQEFPQNFAEALGSPAPPTPYRPWTVLIPNVPPSAAQPYTYNFKMGYKSALKSPAYDASYSYLGSPRIEESQSAAMLVLILTQGKGGAATNPEQIAPTMLLDFPQQGGGTVQLRVFRDEWGHPISFRRWADDDQLDVLGDLNNPQYAPTNNDDEDPEGRLKVQGWPNRDFLKSYLASNPPAGKRPILVDPFDGRNRGPFVFSAGRDGTFFSFSDDNLYSYRLQRR